MQNDDRSNVIPFRRDNSRPAASGVMRVARKISGEMAESDGDFLRRQFVETCKASLDLYENAAVSRLDHDEAGALLLEETASEFLEEVISIGEELARL